MLYTPATARRIPCQWNASRAPWPLVMSRAMHAKCRAACSSLFMVCLSLNCQAYGPHTGRRIGKAGRLARHAVRIRNRMNPGR